MMNCDILVVGAGMVGAAAANQLAKAGYEVVLADQHRPATYEKNKLPDLRVSAISPGSAKLLEACDSWASILTQRACSYNTMTVTAANGGKIGFNASEHGLKALGWIVENRLIQATLWEKLPASVQTLTGHSFESLTFFNGGVLARFDNQQEVTAKLIVAADGGRSAIREQLKIDTMQHDYEQVGLVAVLETEIAQPKLAWQRFLNTGPLALLPLGNHQVSMVWSMAAELASEKKALQNKQLEAELMLQTNAEFGKIKLMSTVAGFPLKLQLTKKMVHERVVFVGDAAHQVHPLAGQGVNLGFADVHMLSSCLAGDLTVLDMQSELDRELARFERRRLSENTLMARGIDGLEYLFKRLPGSSAVGMNIANRLWPLKDQFIRRACALND